MIDFRLCRSSRASWSQQFQQGRRGTLTVAVVGDGSIKNLEEFLGVRLLRRTTRRLNLTLEGTSYYESCRSILGRSHRQRRAFT